MKHVKCVEKTHVLMRTKSTSAVRANQRSTHAIHANHDAHSSRLTFHMYTRALNVDFYVIDLSCTHMLFSMYFLKRAMSCSYLMHV